MQFGWTHRPRRDSRRATACPGGWDSGPRPRSSSGRSSAAGSSGCRPSLASEVGSPCRDHAGVDPGWRDLALRRAGAGRAGGGVPASGGVFVYLREAYGPLVAFLFGWTQLFLAPASVGSDRAGLRRVLGHSHPALPAGRPPGGRRRDRARGGCRLPLGPGLGSVVTAASGAKVAAIATLVIAAFLLGDGEAGALGRQAPAERGALGRCRSRRWSRRSGPTTASTTWSASPAKSGSPGRVLPRALLARHARRDRRVPGRERGLPVRDAVRCPAGSPLVASDTMVRVVGTGAPPRWPRW